ncbi:MAG: DUF4837 family protein [Flavobacteriales bacterium]|nr:MAG: DUF4837 family protein [Flavobacteriales bacterium]MBX2958960.1 DUF4837 family protein [Flavobacteriales bacterium]
MAKENHYFSLFAFLLISFGMVSCDEINEKVLPRASGKSGNLLVVVDSFYWNNKTGEAIMQAFAKEQEGLPQREPIFDIIQLPRQHFAQIFKTNRNIIMVEINPETKNKLTINSDVWSESQLVVTISAPTDAIAAQTIEKNAKVLADYFNNKEIERLNQQYAKNKNPKANNVLKNKFNLEMNLESYYRVAIEDSNFVWLRKDKTAGEHPINQGLLVYSYPYTSDSTFTVNSLVDKRNEITKKYIKGTNDSTFMQTYAEYLPKAKEVSLNGLYAKELRGLWLIKGDFMGGPFVSYSFVDEKRNRVICIDGHVFAPKFDKREFLRELEAIALGAKLEK